jgi:hypothetical protein
MPQQTTDRQPQAAKGCLAGERLADASYDVADIAKDAALDDRRTAS